MSIIIEFLLVLSNYLVLGRPPAPLPDLALLHARACNFLLVYISFSKDVQSIAFAIALYTQSMS